MEYENEQNGVHVYMLHLPVELHRAARKAAQADGMSLKRWIMQVITPELVAGGYLPEKQPVTK